MRVVEPAKVTMHASPTVGLLFTELDRPNCQPCIKTKEFVLVRNMLIAAVEERYRLQRCRHAGQWRDKPTRFRGSGYRFSDGEIYT